MLPTNVVSLYPFGSGLPHISYHPPDGGSTVQRNTERINQTLSPLAKFNLIHGILYDLPFTTKASLMQLTVSKVLISIFPSSLKRCHISARLSNAQP